MSVASASPKGGSLCSLLTISSGLLRNTGRGVIALIELHSQATWRRSSRCESGACVEVAWLNEAVAVRDSKIINGPLLLLGRPQWDAFLAGIRIGDFELK